MYYHKNKPSCSYINKKEKNQHVMKAKTGFCIKGLNGYIVTTTK